MQSCWCQSPNAVALISGQTGKLMYVMHNSEYPLSCFALFENGPCLIADANFDTLMVKLKGFFQNAKANKIESRGTRYQYCDFLVKVGTVTMGPSARGISVEVRIIFKGYIIQPWIGKSHARGSSRNLESPSLLCINCVTRCCQFVLDAFMCAAGRAFISFSQQGLIQAGTVGLSCAYRKACR